MKNGDTRGRELDGNRLYRDSNRGLLFGVCAGLAEYFGFDLSVTRVLVVIGAFFFPIVILGYLLLALLLPKAPAGHGYGDSEADALHRQIRSEPHGALASVRHRYRELDARLQRLETYVTSERFKLDREFDRLRD